MGTSVGHQAGHRVSHRAGHQVGRRACALAHWQEEPMLSPQDTRAGPKFSEILKVTVSMGGLNLSEPVPYHRTRRLVLVQAHEGTLTADLTSRCSMRVTLLMRSAAQLI